MSNETLYDDGRTRLDEDGVTLRRYFFPLGSSKHIRYGDIRSAQIRPMSWRNGKGRLWGSGGLRFWAPLDVSRLHKDRLILLDLGGHIRPAFSPDEPDRVMDILSSRASSAG